MGDVNMYEEFYFEQISNDNNGAVCYVSFSTPVILEYEISQSHAHRFGFRGQLDAVLIFLRCEEV